MLGLYTCHGLANRLGRMHVPILPKLIDYFIRLVFGCWFPHTVKTGKGLTLGYGGLGVVIHSECVLGDNVHIDQGVTLGGNATQKGVPTLGSNVYVGCGAKILGPISIGNDVVIGANSVVIRDAPSNTVVAGVPARVIRENIRIEEYLHHLKRGRR